LKLKIISLMIVVIALFFTGIAYSVPNVMTTDSYSFEIVDDLTPPYTANPFPAHQAIDIAKNTEISVDIKDDGLGVDVDTIVLTVNGVIVSATISSGDVKTVHVSYNPTDDFMEGSTVYWTVDASDLHE